MISTAKPTLDELINEILSDLKKRKLTIWCGSGISRNSGIPVVNSFIYYFLTKIGIDEVDISPILERAMKLPFEAFMAHLAESFNIKDLLNVFANGNSNANHLFIAEMAKSNLTNRIYTTNFDELIEKAFAEYKLKYSVIDYTSSECQSDAELTIHKLHGTIGNAQDISIRLQLVANGKWKQKIRPLIEELIHNEDQNYVLVLGYSFSDFFDINPALETTHSDTSYFLVIDHRSNGFEVSDLSNHPVLKNFKGKIISMNTDEFIEKLRTSICPDGVREAQFIENNWQAHIDSWIKFHTDQIPASFINWIPRIYEHLERLDLSEKYLLRAIEMETDPIRLATPQGNLAGLYYRQKRFEEAIQITERNLSIYESNKKDHMNALIQLGEFNVAEAERIKSVAHLKKAYSFFEKALGLAIEMKSTRDKLGIKLNIVRVLYRKDLPWALEAANELISESESEGYLEILADALNNKGLILIEMKEAKEAFIWFKKSQEVSTEINYQIGVTNATANINRYLNRF